MYIIKTTRKRDGSEQRTEVATGFIVTNGGHIITCAHGMVPSTDSDSETVYQASRGPYISARWILEYIRLEQESDIALFKLPPDPDMTWKPLPITSSTDVRNATPLITFAFRAAQNLTTIVGNVSNRDGPRGWFQTDLATNPGNSGAPVFDVGKASGQVVGIVVAGLPEDQRTAYVIPSDYLRPILSRVGINF
jgi:S1-C subfamily serine protease